MIPIVSIVGRKNSGKTTLIKGIVPELKKRGYRVGTIKHHSHELSLEDVDKMGKDTYEHQSCGADAVVLSASNKLMLFRAVKEHQGIDDISQTYLRDMDIILTEGYKLENKPKIEIFRQEIGRDQGLLCNQKGDNLAAVVSDSAFDITVPCFGLLDHFLIADFLEKKFILPKKLKTVELTVDGKSIFLNSFVREILEKTVLGMISPLRGVPDAPQRVEISISKNRL
ncbi:molybdopterin-guanine dinucleotide biosynthesis protein B [Candidatus Desantisbacteria bacterium]|nr:molybdopterin-guanine dinucleotide biosynthesis protein B [Candidatus Desantisbacteria bacterium]